MNLSGFHYDLERRERELVGLGEITALIFELVKPPRFSRLGPFAHCEDFILPS